MCRLCCEFVWPIYTNFSKEKVQLQSAISLRVILLTDFVVSAVMIRPACRVAFNEFQAHSTGIDCNYLKLNVN